MNENMNVCSECGCTDEELFELYIDGEFRRVCADCAKDLGFVQCDDCGNWVPEDEALTTADGDTICESCYESDYFTCENCGEIHHVDDMVVVNRDTRREEYVCEDCADQRYYRCDECGEYFDSDFVHTDSDDNCICDSCWDRGDWVYCDDCGRIIRCEDANWNEDDEVYYCDDCWSEHEHRSFHDYGYKPTPEFQYRSGEAGKQDSILTFGVELEVDCGDDHNDLADDLVQLNQPIYMKHDGSLGSEGVEIVTHPCSLAYHQYELRWAEISRTCRSHDYKSHDAETCGLHIHIGRKQMGSSTEERLRTAGNLVLLVDSIWSQLVTFTRRTDCQLSRWSDRPCTYIIPGVEYTDDELTNMALATRNRGRYQTVNLTNSSTVELRCFRGTLKRDTIIASLQLASNMTRYAMTHTPTECRNATWADVVGVEQFKELDQYNRSRGLC